LFTAELAVPKRLTDTGVAAPANVLLFVVIDISVLIAETDICPLLGNAIF
jgi:hypothetical protein